eukprot:GILJ01004489.1.p1 GENE.GILJ01004489.1~~GILJ01004489.1.p1  ORF type:complete len:1089 (+),score=177.81 GILJ01004489.1:291-3269(+)
MESFDDSNIRHVGVTRSKGGRFTVRIWVKEAKQRKTVGTFETEGEAIVAYEEAKKLRDAGILYGVMLQRQRERREEERMRLLRAEGLIQGGASSEQIQAAMKLMKEKDENKSDPVPKKMIARKTMMQLAGTMIPGVDVTTAPATKTVVDEGPTEVEILSECSVCSVKKHWLYRHPLLDVGLCEKCIKFYYQGGWTKDELGKDLFCRWCGDGGSILQCDFCTRAFCCKCIKKHFGKQAVDEAELGDWSCFACDPAPIEEFKKRHPFKARKLRSIEELEAQDEEIQLQKQKQKKKKQREPLYFYPDISRGQEKVAIPVYNYIDTEKPAPFSYITHNVEGENVVIGRRPAFLIGCQCEESCTVGSKCDCSKMQGSAFAYNKDRKLIRVKRAIFECNYKCKCNANLCKNRVVGKGVQLRLQVFKTSNRGWGVRCEDWIRAGTFVCEYAGEILSEADAEKRGVECGDEYLFDMDTNVRYEKEGYEDCVQEPEEKKKEVKDSPLKTRESKLNRIGGKPGGPAGELTLDMKLESIGEDGEDSALIHIELGSETSRDAIDVTSSRKELENSSIKELPSTDADSDVDSRAVHGVVADSAAPQNGIDSSSRITRSAKKKQQEDPSSSSRRGRKRQPVQRYTPGDSHMASQSDNNMEQDGDQSSEEEDEKDNNDIDIDSDSDSGSSSNKRSRQSIARNSKNGATSKKSENVDMSMDETEVDSKTPSLKRGRGRPRGSKQAEQPTIQQSTPADSGGDAADEATARRSKRRRHNGDTSDRPGQKDELAREPTSSVIDTGTADAMLIDSDKVKDMSPTNNEQEDEEEDETPEPPPFPLGGKVGGHPRDLCSLGGHPFGHHQPHRHAATPPKRTQQQEEAASPSQTIILMDPLTGLERVVDSSVLAAKDAVLEPLDDEDEDPEFCIDAKWYGNVGRFINHSCDPNLIKQSVFVDTQDVRFPRLAFFAYQDIPPMTELTYDYGYRQGSVEGRHLDCLCGSQNCIKQLF